MKQKLLSLLAVMLLAVGTLQAQLQLVTENGGAPFVLNNEVYYSSTESIGSNLYSYKLWKTNGTTKVLLFQRDQSFAWDEPTFGISDVVGDHLFFVYSPNYYGSPLELWSTDGTVAGTKFLTDIGFGPYTYNSFASFGNSFLFTIKGSDNYQLNKLFITDGTPDGTKLIKEFPDSEGRISTPEVADNTIYFTYNSDKTELWKSDGTAVGTQLVTVGDFYSMNNFAALNGAHYFIANRTQLRRIDDSQTGSTLIKSFPAGSYSAVSMLTTMNGQLYYSADDGVNGVELWKSDGSTVGTVLIKDINPGPSGAFENNATSKQIVVQKMGNTLYFIANDGVHGTELWKTDGTSSGTILVKDINPGAASSSPNYSTIGDGRLYFNADDGAHGRDIWVSNGTSAGTSLLIDLAPVAHSFGTQLAFSNQALYFNGQPTGRSRGLWKYTPASASTVSISSFAPMSAPVGAGVAIHGANFIAGSTVRFNGVAATQVSFESPTLLIATVPSGATSGPIQVSNANGTATSSGSLTVAEVSSLWQAKSALPTARTQHGAVAISSNGRVYAFGGTNGTELSSLEIYNTNAFAWTTGSPIPTPTRGAAFVRGTDNQIYLFSGYGGGSNRSQSYKYNPATNVWTALANLPTPVWAASAAASGNLIYLFGGQTTAGTASNQVQVYNTQTNSWTTAAAMPTALMQAQAVSSYNGKIYLFGGRTAAQGGLSDAVLVYNPTTNAWSTGASMPVPKAQFGVVLNNDGRIFVVGGRGSYVPNQGPFFHSVEIFDPKTNTWSEGPALPSAVGGQTLVNSYGNLFMMGGIDGAYRNYNWRLVLPPVAPTSAKATAISSSQIKVEWVDAAGNENRYEVERASSAAGPWTVIATTAANAITHTDGSRPANTTYFYRVRGGNSSGYGAYSAIVSATTWATGANARESVEVEATSLNLQAAPNPFHSQTTVTFTAQESGRAVLDLYDLQGVKLQQVFNEEVQAGEKQQAQVNGSRLGQGLYLLRLANGSQMQNLKVLINK